MADLYVDLKGQLSEAEAGVYQAIKSLKQALTRLQSESANLGQFPSKYSGLVTAIVAQATANPGDTEWQDLKDVAQRANADYQSVKTMIDAAITAVDGILNA